MRCKIVRILTITLGMSTAAAFAADAKEEVKPATTAVSTEEVATLIDESVPAWVKAITIKGDARLRFEGIDDDAKDYTRTRARVRARIGAYADANEDVNVGIRLASGSDDPASSNQTLDGAFTSKAIWLDLAYVKWDIMSSGFDFIGGKMKKPFVCVSDLVWDGDVNPEGGALTYTLDMAEGVDLGLNAGVFYIDEIKDGDDRMLYTGQAAFNYKAEGFTVVAGGSIYYYENMKGYGPLYDDSFFGNSSVDDTFADEFTTVELFASVGTKVGKLPLTVFGQYATNTEADDDDDTGFLIGATLGKAKKQGEWQLGYDYRMLEKDAVVGVFADSDSWGGGTDGQGHRISAKYAILKNWTFGGTLFVNEYDIASGEDKTDYLRYQIDLACKF
ncbi:MAG: putative porin [Kiritimatiellae bacterium]|jgi:hypothetical protein|nr:putative porin [Kiritimatiellia bacterium]